MSESCHYCGRETYTKGEQDAFLVGKNRHAADVWPVMDEMWFRTRHMDHKVPQSKGGTNDPCNLVVACQSCNLRKGAMLYEDFLVKVAERRQDVS